MSSSSRSSTARMVDRTGEDTDTELQEVKPELTGSLEGTVIVLFHLLIFFFKNKLLNFVPLRTLENV